MVVRLYVLHDLKTQSYGHIMQADRDESIKAVIKASVNDPRYGFLYQYPQDYDLVYLGDYDTKNCILMPLSNERNEFICNLAELKSTQKGKEETENGSDEKFSETVAD